MKQYLIAATALLWAVAVSGAPKTDSVVCRIEGRVVGRPESKELLLSLQNSHSRFAVPIRIPIVDSAFSYTLTVAAEQPYQLIFADEDVRNNWVATPFMAERGVVRFVLYPEDDAYEKNRVEGGKLNDRYRYLVKEGVKRYPLDDFYARHDELGQTGRLYSEAYSRFLNELNGASDQTVRDSLYRVRNRLEAAGERYSAEGKAVERARDSVQRLQSEWLIAHLKQVRRPSAADLAVLYEQLYNGYVYKNSSVDTARYRNLFRAKYAKPFAMHPLAEQIELVSGRSIAVGSLLPDAVAVDPTSGKSHSVLELTQGKVAVIDLWASWCGPCMRLSSSIIPVWEKYKNRGFTVVGIAREQGNASAMLKAVDRLKLPWPNLVELNDAGSIWLRYGIDNAAGGVVLVDRTGKILAVDFTAAELEQHLEKLLAKQ